MKKNIIFIGIVIAVVLFINSFDDTWESFLYPDKNNLSVHIELGEFGSLEDCRDAILGHARMKGMIIGTYDYECGLNCKDSGGLKVCKETAR